MQIDLRRSLDNHESFVQAHRKRQQKRVHYQDQSQPGCLHNIDKEDIFIPEPGPRHISKAELILAAIMAPGDGSVRTKGLVGKPLL